MNKFIVIIRESTNKPNELNRAFLSALSSWTLSWKGCFNNSFQIGSCLSPGKSSNLKLFSDIFRAASFKADITQLCKNNNCLLFEFSRDANFFSLELAVQRIIHYWLFKFVANTTNLKSQLCNNLCIIAELQTIHSLYFN